MTVPSNPNAAITSGQMRRYGVMGCVGVLTIVWLAFSDPTTSFVGSASESSLTPTAATNTNWTHWSPKQRAISAEFEPLREHVSLVHGQPVRGDCIPQPAEKYIYKGLTNTKNEDQPKYLSTYLFPDLEHGIFVEAGAARAKGSNTFLFEKNRCWTGMCVEPTQQFYNSLLEERKNCYVINGALANTSKVRQFWDVTGRPWRSGFADTMTDAAKQEIKNQKWAHKVVSVKTFLLHELLASHGMWHVDLISLDCEGCEPEVLENFRFDIITVDVFLIEMLPNIREQILHLMETNGYEWVACAGPHDGVFVRKMSERYHKHRAKLPSLESTCAAS